MDIALTLGLLVLLAGVGWVVAKVFRGGAPIGESSARADTYAADAGYGPEQMDNIRNKQVK
jgi:hypothetical protein